MTFLKACKTKHRFAFSPRHHHPRFPKLASLILRPFFMRYMILVHLLAKSHVLILKCSVLLPKCENLCLKCQNFCLKREQSRLNITD